jgi:hypothetical protein
MAAKARGSTPRGANYRKEQDLRVRLVETPVKSKDETRIKRQAAEACDRPS